MNMNRALALAVIVLAFVAVPGMTHAQFDETGFVQTTQAEFQSVQPPCTTKFCPLANVDGSQKLSGIYSDAQVSLAKFVNGLFKVALSVGAILAVLQLTRAGFMYMGSDMWSSKARAREIIGNATIGLLLLIAIFLILNLINPNLLNLDVFKNLPAIPTVPSASPQPQTQRPQNAFLSPTQDPSLQGCNTSGCDPNNTPQNNPNYGAPLSP